MSWEIPQLNYSNVLFDPSTLSNLGSDIAGALQRRKDNRNQTEAGNLLSQWAMGSAPDSGSLGARLMAASAHPGPQAPPQMSPDDRIAQAFDVAGEPRQVGSYSDALGIAPPQFRQAYADAGQQNGIDPGLLIRQGQQESGFDPNAVSKAGATGIAQFMPGTAADMGVDPTDPVSSIQGQGRYDAANLKKFGGNTGLALAAYNWGPANVQKWLQSGGDLSQVPAETQAYVQKITGKPLQAWVAGGEQGAPQGTPQAAPEVMPQGGAPAAPQSFADSLPDRATLAAMLRNPITRPLAVQLVQNARQGIASQFDFQRVNNSLVRINKRTGEVTPVFEAAPTAKAGSAPSAADTDNAKTIAQAIANGDQPPVLTGLYKLSGPVRAELERNGYDLTKASQDWEATKKNIASMNGPQQLRLRQTVGMVRESLPLVQELADKWDAGGYPALNKAELIAAKQGVLGPDAQSIATQLEAEIADITSELGTVYKGGNSSTDESLKLAAMQLSADWSPQQLHDAIELAKKNIQYRWNSINQATAGIPNSQYDPNRPDAGIGGENDKSGGGPLIYNPDTGDFE